MEGQVEEGVPPEAVKAVFRSAVSGEAEGIVASEVTEVEDGSASPDLDTDG